MKTVYIAMSAVGSCPSLVGVFASEQEARDACKRDMDSTWEHYKKTYGYGIVMESFCVPHMNIDYKWKHSGDYGRIHWTVTRAEVPA